MTINIKINTGGSAFEENKADEIVRLINEYVIPAVYNKTPEKKLIDINGNVVGAVTIKGR